MADRRLLVYSARDWKTTYTDNRGRKGKDGAGVYSRLGAAVTPRH